MMYRVLSAASFAGLFCFASPGRAGVPTATTCSVPTFQTYGAPVKIVAAVASADGTSPSGSVNFLDLGSTFASVTLMPSGTAQITTTLRAGTHAITCSYLGDTNRAASTSGIQMVVIGTVTPQITITASPSTPSPGQRVEIDVILSAKTGTPTGNVALIDNGALLATLQLMDLDNGAIGSLITSTLTPGVHSLTASYSGDVNFTAATTTNPLVLVVGSASTSIQLAASPNPVQAGQMVTLTAGVTSAAGVPPGAVTFQTSQGILGTATLNVAAQATLTTSFAGAGSQMITASYGGSGVFQASTSAVFSLPVIPRKLVIVLAPSGSAPVAADSIVSLFGDNLASAAMSAPSAQLPTVLGGASVVVADSAGVQRAAALAYVSPAQINAVVPAGTAVGQATVTVRSSAGDIAGGSVAVADVAPAVFSADGSGSGAAAALAETVHADGSITNQSVFSCMANKCMAEPIDLGGDGDQTVLVLFGTGIRHGGSATVLVGGLILKPDYAGAQSAFAGLDQVNVTLPQSLRGTGDTAVSVSAGGRISNAVSIHLN